MTIAVRKYEQADRADLVRCMEELQDFVAATDPHKRLRRLKEYGERYTDDLLKYVKKHDGLILFACDRKKVVGCIAGIIEVQSDAGLLECVPTKAGRVLELFVKESRRNSGIGTMLMKRMEEYFKQNECTVVKVEVSAPNTLAHDFYLGLDYQNMTIDMIKLFA